MLFRSLGCRPTPLHPPGPPPGNHAAVVELPGNSVHTFDKAQTRSLRAAARRDDLGHEAVLVSAADSGHEGPTAQVAAEYYPATQLRAEMAAAAPFVSIDKARRLFGYTPRYSWRQQGEEAENGV